MYKVVLCTDLDSTLIYGTRYRIPGRVCVEVLGERRLSFMSPLSYRLLQQVMNAGIPLIPVTSRKIPSYRRVERTIGYPEFALLSHGGLLLRNGAVEEDWYQESLALAEDSYVDLKLAEEYLHCRDDLLREVSYEHGLFIRAKCSNPEDAAEDLRNMLAISAVNVFVLGQWVDVVPASLNKGGSVKRLRKLFSGYTVIAAGDSEMDIPMLEEADIGLAPISLKGAGKFRIYDDLFSDHLLQFVLDYVKG